MKNSERRILKQIPRRKDTQEQNVAAESEKQWLILHRMSFYPMYHENGAPSDGSLEPFHWTDTGGFCSQEHLLA